MAFFLISVPGCSFFPVVKKAEQPIIEEEEKVVEEKVIQEQVVTQPMK